MAKYRVCGKGSLVTINSKLVLGEQINERELELFESQLFRGCFRPKRSGKKKIVYTAPGAIELKKYLERSLSEIDFYELLVQILEMAKRIEGAGLYLPNLVLNIDFVFVNERTKELFFVYQPIRSRYAGGNVYAFVGEIVQRFSKNHGASVVFLEKLKLFLKDTTKYRIAHMEEYIKAECPQAYDRIIQADVGRSGFITNDKMAYAKHYQQEQSGSMKTTLLSDGVDATTLLCEEETTLLTVEHFPCLQRLKTGESIEIRTPLFRIGKSGDNDFVIADNKAISRSHAIIEKRNDCYYITDQKSTNHSYINNKLLEAGVERVLRYGDLIRLADEEFSFKE